MCYCIAVYVTTVTHSCCVKLWMMLSVAVVSVVSVADWCVLLAAGAMSE